ncbi:hypothetical protein [Chryseobacterium angstadtii]|uniref:hypothetical protein n=1 Tax=Chryseobacterium angstadtii TaxID=558151 RepID=UPI00065AD5C8|nr:hypothetical protein [Chryseobacterium angstadtii]
MKKIIVLGVLFLIPSVKAQVGVNTTNPAATLDVVAKNLSATSVDGIIAPRIDRLKAFNMSGVPDGTLIYINNISTGTATGQTVNITSTGYYYFEGTAWRKLDTGNVNIYTSDGTLGNNRTVTMGTNNITWSSTAAATTATNLTANSITTGRALDISTTGLTTGTALNITSTNGNNTNGVIKIANTSASGAGTFATLQANNTAGAGVTILNSGNVGVGTATPGTRLEINNGTTNGAVKITDGTQGAGKVLTSDSNGLATWQNTTVTNVTGITPTVSTPYGTTADKYMNAYIDLPQGRWFIFIGFLVNGATAADTRYASRLTLSDSNTALSTNNFSFINNNSLVLTQQSTGGAGAFTYGMFSAGIIRVDVSAANLRLYIWDTNTRAYGNTSTTSLNQNGENYVFAIKAN